MDRYFTVKNCVVPDVTPMDPWTFDVSNVVFDLDEDPIKSKAEYKRRYFKNPSANHCLFSMVKGSLPNLIVSNGTRSDNQAAEIFGFVGDYDATVGDNIIENLQAHPMGTYLPTRWSRTQGNNFRLIWEFESGVRVESSEHANKLLEEIAKRISAVKWGAVFDREACCNCAQHFDVGREWGEFSEQRIPLDVLKLWDFEVYTKLRTKTKRTYDIPFEKVVEEVNKQYPGRIDFTFAEGQRCRRFWDPASDNRDGCVIMKEGVRVFVPHDKPFMSWSDILGQAFVDQFLSSKVSPVVQKIWFNNRGNEFVRWKTNDKKYVSRDATTLRRDLVAEAGLHSDKKKGELMSEVDLALHDITDRREVDYAAPIIYFPHGPMTIDGGMKVLNTSTLRAATPSNEQFIPEGEHWLWSNPRAKEKFPFIYGVISTMFEQSDLIAKERLDTGFAEPVDETKNIQLQIFLSWLSAFYVGAVTLNPTQGQCLVLAGPHGTGKSFLSMEIIGKLLGGAKDADKYYVDGNKFTGGLFYSGVHLIDDKICEMDYRTRAAFTTRLKVAVASARLNYEEKFRNEVPSVPWLGRVVITCNMDAKSLSILPDLEQSNADKITMLKIGPHRYPFFPFEQRKKNTEAVERELPYFAKFMLEYERDIRFFDRRMGVKAYQHPDMKAAAAENGFTNVVIDALRQTVDSLVAENQISKVKSGVDFVALTGSARYIFDRIADVSQSAAKDVGGARQLAAQLSQMEARKYNIVRRKQRGSWIYEIPVDFDVIKGADSIEDAEFEEGVVS